MSGTKSFPADNVKLHIGTAADAPLGTMAVLMKTNKYYTNGSLLQTGVQYTVTKEWGQDALTRNWCSDVAGVFPETETPNGSVVGAEGSAITRTDLITLAEADGLTPGALYLTTDGLQCQALTARFLQPIGPWFVDGRRWSVGAATSAADLTYCYLPPLAPNAQVEIWHQWSMDAVNVTKRGRIYLDGTLGGGVAGAQAVYTRNFTDATTKMFPSFHRVQNRNDAASQICQGVGDSAVFGLSTSDPVALTVSTNTSKLLRAMGETSKSGSNVTITGITRIGTTATATATAHGLTTGDFIGVTGATGTGSTQYNTDPAQVTVVDANTFTYVMASDPGASASGSPVFQKYVSLALVSFRVAIHQGLGF